jgi:hypothetical protein
MTTECLVTLLRKETCAMRLSFLKFGNNITHCMEWRLHFEVCFMVSCFKAMFRDSALR